MKLDFEYIEQALLDYKAKSEYKQASIIMLRNIFKEAETKQCDIPVVSNSVICCPQCGNERLESTGGGWYICSDRSCDWGDKL